MATLTGVKFSIIIAWNLNGVDRVRAWDITIHGVRASYRPKGIKKE